MHTFIRQPLTIIQNPGVLGGKAPVQDMLRSVKTHSLYARLFGNVVVATGGAGNVRDEAYANIVSQFRVLEGGNPLIDITGPVWSYLTKKYSRQITANVAGTGLPSTGSALAAGTYPIEVDFRLDFAKIFSAGDPAETCLIDVQKEVKTQVEITWASQSNNVIGTANPANVNLSGLSIQFVQKYDSAAGTLPYFVPRIYRGPSSGQISGTSTDYPTLFYPQGSNRIEAVLFRSLTDGFTNDGVLTNTVTFRGDRTKYWDKVQFQEVLDEYARFFDNPSTRPGYLDFHLRENGKLSEMFIGGQDQNPRILADVTNPGGTSTFEWYTFELESVDGTTKALVDAAGKPLPF